MNFPKRTPEQESVFNLLSSGVHHSFDAMAFFQQAWSASNLFRASSLFPRPVLADVQHCELSPLELRINRCFSVLRPSRSDLFDHLKIHNFSFSLLHLNLTAKVGEIEHKLRTALHRADFHDECHKDAKLFLEISNASQVSFI